MKTNKLSEIHSSVNIKVPYKGKSLVADVMLSTVLRKHEKGARLHVTARRKRFATLPKLILDCVVYLGEENKVDSRDLENDAIDTVLTSFVRTMVVDNLIQTVALHHRLAEVMTNVVEGKDTGEPGPCEGCGATCTPRINSYLQDMKGDNAFHLICDECDAIGADDV